MSDHNKRNEEENWLYLECSSGISGDMTVGALLDLGASRKRLEAALDSLGIDGYHLHFGRTKKCGIDAFDFDVHLEDGHTHTHTHTHAHSHTHDQDHADGCPHDHIHRNIQDVFAVIDRLKEEEGVKNLAKKMFTIVGEAESKAHGIPVEQVHFHEVGAIDSIVDIIGTAVCFVDLGVTQVVVSALAEGRGHVRCQHGVMPVPVPATVNIAAAYSLKLRLTEQEGEMVTPTGAAIAAALRTTEELPEHYYIERIGLGAGTKDFQTANILRAMLIEPADQTADQTAAQRQPGGVSRESEPENRELWILETNLDDCTGEAMGYILECLMEEGARDAWYTAACMKKNRPAYVLHVLCEEEKKDELEALVFAHTTTIGIRSYPVKRRALKRRVAEVQTRYGAAGIKYCVHEGQTYVYPEYESVKQICQSQGLSFTEVYHELKEDGKTAIGNQTGHAECQ